MSESTAHGKTLTVFQNILDTLIQITVNLHLELERTQRLLDHLIGLNQEVLKIPSEDAIRQIEALAMMETKKVCQFFTQKEVDNEENMSIS